MESSGGNGGNDLTMIFTHDDTTPNRWAGEISCRDRDPVTKDTRRQSGRSHAPLWIASESDTAVGDSWWCDGRDLTSRVSQPVFVRSLIRL